MVSTAKTTTWTFAELESLYSNLWELMDSNMSGFSSMRLTRAHQTASESVTRSVSTLLPGMEVTYTVSAGVEKTYINFLYVLATDAGDLVPPKDATRREMALAPGLEQKMRQQVWAAVEALGNAFTSLSPAWWRQLGRETAALEAEAELISERRRAAEKVAEKGRRLAIRRALKETHEIDQIVDERRSKLPSRAMFLVRWAGYDSSWEAWRTSGEVGTAIETWEPWSKVKNTEAFFDWRGDHG